jgi:hypothetical protein
MCLTTIHEVAGSILGTYIFYLLPKWISYETRFTEPRDYNWVAKGSYTILPS